MQSNYDSAKLSGWLDQLLSAGIQLGGSILAGSGSSSTGQAKGLQAITAFVGQVLSALDQIKAQAVSVPVANKAAIAQQTLTQAQQIADTLSNSQYVYQAKNGQDAAVLQQGKSQAAAKLQEIAAIFSGESVPVTQPNTPNTPNTQPTTPVTLPNGQVVYIPVTQPASGIDNQTLLIYGGLGLALIFLLK